MSRHGKILGITIFMIFFLQSPVFAKRIGLIFGTDYRGNAAGVPALELCEKDARLMEQALKRHGKFDYVKVLLGPRVTAQNMKSELKKVASITKKNDTVIIYFSGHGTVQKDSRAPNGMRNYLIMYERPHVSDKNLDVWLKKIKSNKTVWIFDACFSGGIVKKGSRGMGRVPVRSNGGTVVQNGNDSLYFENKTLISSSASNERAFELDELGHGLFTFWFTKSMNPNNGDLNGDHVVSVLEAFEWTSKRVRSESKKKRRNQNPQIVGSPSGILIAGNIRPRSIEELEVEEQKTFKKDTSRQHTNEQTKDKGTVTTTTEESVTITTKKEITVQMTVETVAPEVVEIPVVEKPSRPADPVTEEEPSAEISTATGRLEIITTILQSRQAGRTTMDSRQVMKMKKLGNVTRKIRVQVSGNIVPAKIEWVDRNELKKVSGEDIPLGFYSFNMKRYKNRVAVITIEDIPAGIHEVVIEADDYPLIKERVGVEKNAQSRVFTIASLAGYGSIQGKVFRDNYDSPVKGQKVWLPTVKGVNQIHTMRTTSDGSFWFLNLPPSDDYQLKASIMESISLDNEKLNVRSGDVLRLDVVLGKNFR
ncbi:MAG: caspase family protein [Spirochaetia bacterium]|nr:caspase family protein [Spirochaetia bacterium]